MSEATQSPDFDSIKNISPYGAEYWSARDLSKLLGYTEWRNFEVAINRARTSCEQIGQNSEYQFVGVNKLIEAGKGAKREVKDYVLSRLACYLIAQNGDPRKPEIAAAQAYFATATREHEIDQLRADQNERLELRERISESNKALAEAAYHAGVLSKNFGILQDAGYKGLYGGLGLEDIKTKKGVGHKEDLLDRMGASELAANDFRATQTRDKLRRENIIGQAKVIATHRSVGQTVRKAIEEIGGIMPEELPAEPTIKPLLDKKKRKQKKLAPAQSQAAMSLESEEPKQN